MPNIIQRRAESQKNCTLLQVELSNTVPEGPETEQLVLDEDCANETQIPIYNYFKVGHVFTGEVSSN